MKKTLLSLLLLTSLNYALPVYAKVMHFATDDMTVVDKDAVALSKRYTGEKVLLAYDIDNTLLAPIDNGSPAKNTDLMTTQWWDWQANLIATHSTSASRVATTFEQLIAINDTVLPLMNLVKIDAHLDQTLHNEQQILHNKVIAISSRDVMLYSASIHQLAAVNIDFSHSALGDASGIAGYITPPPFTRPIEYNRGVVVVSGQDKGETLKFLLHYYPAQPIKAIIFIDDTQANIDKVSAAFKDSALDVHVYLYTKEKARVDAFNADNKEHVSAQWREINAALKESFGLSI